MSEQKGYIGRIQNAGTQVVKAPMQTAGNKTGKVHMGNDLRQGKK